MAKPHPAFSVRVANRETAEEKDIQIVAKDQHDAMVAAMKQGWLVVSAQRVPAADEQREFASSEAGSGIPSRAVLARVSSIYRLGILSSVVGLVFMIAAFAYNTAPEGVHNIGLLNDALVFGLAGVAGMVSGAVLCSVAVVGGGIVRILASIRL